MITKENKLALIRSGREAIEYAMLDIVIKSFKSTAAEEHDLEALSQLLKDYNRLIDKHQRSLFNVQASNDEVNKQEK